MLKNVYHVSGMEKNLLPLLYNRSQLEKEGNWFGPESVKIYSNLQII